MLGFLLETITISLSGVMAPGPLSAAAVGTGCRSRWAGAVMAIGHGVVEWPLMVGIVLGAGGLLRTETFRTGLGLIGGVVLIGMGVLALRGLGRREIEPNETDRRPLLAGLVLSALNPYFLVWWATVGASLLARADAFGWPGLVAFGVAHWLCDLLWLTVLSALAFAGTRRLGRRTRQTLVIACGGALVIFGVKFIVSAEG